MSGRGTGSGATAARVYRYRTDGSWASGYVSGGTGGIRRCRSVGGADRS